MQSPVKHTKGFIRLVSKSKNLYLVGLNGCLYVAWRIPHGVRYKRVW